MVVIRAQDWIFKTKRVFLKWLRIGRYLFISLNNSSTVPKSVLHSNSIEQAHIQAYSVGRA